LNASEQTGKAVEDKSNNFETVVSEEISPEGWAGIMVTKNRIPNHGKPGSIQIII